MKIMYIDIETTGFSTTKHEIIEISFILEVSGKKILSKTFFLRPEKLNTINEMALKICGKSLSEVLTYPDRTAAFQEINNFLKSYKITGLDWYLCGHNIKAFDMRFINISPINLNSIIPIEPFKLIDTLKFIKKQYPKQPHNLQKFYEFCELPTLKEWHNSLTDTIAVRRLNNNLIAKFGYYWEEESIIWQA